MYPEDFEAIHIAMTWDSVEFPAIVVGRIETEAGIVPVKISLEVGTRAFFINLR